MNIVQICAYDLERNGGVQQHIRSLGAALEARGHKVMAIGPGTIGRMRHVSFAGTGFELSRATGPELEALDRGIEAFQPDIMHYHALWVPMLPWQIFRRQRRPSIATFHDTTGSDATGAALRMIFKPLSRYLLRQLDGALAVSTAPLGHLRPGKRGVIPEIIPPVTDLSAFQAIRKPDRQKRPIVLFLGRLEPRKGVAVLLEAWRCIGNGGHAGLLPRLVIAGSGELEPLVREAAEGWGQGSITYVPAPDGQRLRQLMAEATIAVSPAIHGESFGIVLAEMLASGTPVIGAANPGYRHVLTGEGQALLVEPGDAQALAHKIMELLADPAQLGRLGAWGRTHAMQFDVSAHVQRFEAAYASAISRHNGP